MKKIVFGLTMAGALTLGAFGAVSAFATENVHTSPTLTEQDGKDEEKKSFHRKHKMNEERILAEAKELGIETEGKEIRDIGKEVFETKVKTEAKELGIETEGKEVRDIAKEVFETKVKAEAKELGIESEGKEIRAIAKEVREKKVFEAAEQLGIDTKDKTARDLLKEMKENYADEAKELGLFQHKHERLPFHREDKEKK